MSRASVPEPFARRFSHDNPIRAIAIRGFYADGDTVIVLWEGAGTTIEGSRYESTYAWIMTLQDGLIVNGTAFNELWQIAPWNR
jgi:ketosteroid isomerase-like protein